MDIFITGYVLGLCTVIAIGIFIWAVRRGKGNSAGALKRDIDRNNIDTGSGLEKLRVINDEARRLNRQSADLNRRAGDAAREGIEVIENTNSAVSRIIKTAKRDGKNKPEG